MFRTTGPPGLYRGRCRLAICTIVLVLLASTFAQAVEDAPDLPTSTLTIETASNAFPFTVEVATTPRQRAKGLMFRRHLPPDRGMLFDFEREQPVRMWMRNTYIPLDMLFIKGDGTISRIAVDTEPQSDRVISSGGPVRAVLELAGGITRLLGIRPGDRIVHPIFSKG